MYPTHPCSMGSLAQKPLHCDNEKGQPRVAYLRRRLLVSVFVPDLQIGNDKVGGVTDDVEPHGRVLHVDPRHGPSLEALGTEQEGPVYGFVFLEGVPPNLTGAY